MAQDIISRFCGKRLNLNVRDWKNNCVGEADWYSIVHPTVKNFYGLKLNDMLLS